MREQHLNTIAKTYKVEKSLVSNFIKSFGVEETKNILSMSKRDLMVTARMNFLKCTSGEILSHLKGEGIIAEQYGEIPEMLLITKGWGKLGSSQTYLNGEIMPQGYGSMAAVHILDPQPDERILDMAAAPGGKTCFIAERMMNTGIIIANDKARDRIQSLVFNLMRHGIENTVITNQDAMYIKDMVFDRILLDAPCTGEGLIVSNVHRRTSKTLVNNYQMQKIQIMLLKRAISLLKIGGILVYSTCSLTPIENEMVINTILNQVEIIDIQLQVGDTGDTSIHPEFIKAKRFLPSKLKCDGFFIIKLRRIK
ncbi:MAG: RsmB/NOP family class I SAM-dependent RNA methyltransferase [Candidatus Heimdallarchaeota archaeon]|nr:RsmB/NOP family class I SAM-dependent RNA methyltransferase [Candidatus Heimdallarchaeota archaeon]